MSDVYTGGCFCGAVRLEIAAPTKWCAHCHCSMCRRAHGAAYVTWVGVPSSQFRWTAGEATLVRHRSSSNAVRTFCSVCGSSITFESTRWPDEVHVARALVADEIDRAPQSHVFFDERVPWVEVHDDLPKKGGPTGTAPL